MSKMSKLPSSFQEWRDPIEKTINKTLQTNFDKREANQIIKYMFRTGGKRCRPLLVVLSNEALGGDPRNALEAAAAVEIIHAATLVFDDLIDKDQVRRGAPTIHMAFSNEKALTSGLFLASKGVQLESNGNATNRQVLRILKKAGSLEFAKTKAKEYAGAAKDALDRVKRLEKRKILDDYADYLWRRTE